MSDDKTLGYYGIGQGCTLVLCARGQIFVRNLAGKTLALDVGVGETVESTKATITSREGIPPQQQSLVYKGTHLRQGLLKEHGVLYGTTLDLSLCLLGGGGLEVRIQTMTGISFLIQVEQDTTVSALKKKINELKGFPVDQQKLIFAGKIMEDRLTMADYNIQMTTTLHLVVTQPGRKTTQTEVTVITNTGREICCHVALGNPINELMLTIEDMEGIPKNCQQLFCKGQLLDYHKSLRDYNIDETKSVIYLDFKGHSYTGVRKNYFKCW